MPDRTTQPLTFAALDGIAFAATRGRLGRGLPDYVVTNLGPVVEMIQLARAGLLPTPVAASWLRLSGSAPLVRAAMDGVDQWMSPRGGGVGLFKCKEAGVSEVLRWKAFRVEAHKAALAAGFSTQVVSRLMGALGEIRDNVLEHSQATTTGLVAFQSRPGTFEFAVADAGVGALASLKTNSEYDHLRDDGEALECALSDGESRFGKGAGRGTGFSQLFKSLVSLNASLRFRSGDHALSIDGKSPTLVNAHLAKKPRAVGLLTCVLCRLH